MYVNVHDCIIIKNVVWLSMVLHSNTLTTSKQQHVLYQFDVRLC